MLSAGDIYVVEQFLLGRTVAFPKKFIPSDKEAAEEKSLEIIRFCVERYMGWSPEVAYNKLNPSVIEALNLSCLFSSIHSVAKRNADKDFHLIVQKLYPDVVTNSFAESAITIYKRVLDGDIARFPKGFFEGASGENKPILCLRYALNQRHISHSSDILEKYLFFSTREGFQFIRDARLSLPLKTIFDNAVEYYHCAAAPEEKSEFAYMVALCIQK